jgi:phospholipid/cholesterol/gamma-HCH transport system substrate-binding protein
MKLEAKIGLFIVMGFFALFLLSIQLSTVSNFGKKGYAIYADIPNAGGLALNTKVKISGVNVGFIEQIILKQGKPQLKLFIYDGVGISDDSTIFIKQESFLGGKFIEISYGSSANELNENSTLSKSYTYASFDETSDNISLAADDFRHLIQKFDRVFDQNFTNDFKSTMASFKKMAESMGQASDEFKLTGRTINTRLPDIMKQVDFLAYEVNKTSVLLNRKLPSILDNVDDFASEFKGAATTLKEKLPKTFEGLSRIEGELHNILTENRSNLYSTLDNASNFFASGDEAIHKVNDLIDNISSAKLEMNLYGQYMMNDNFAKTSFVIAYIPELSNYYLLEVISAADYTKTDATGKPLLPQKHQKGRYLISAMTGKQYDNIVFRGGIKESSGGVGVDYLNDYDSVKISLDFFDMNAVNDIRGDSPHMTLDFRYRPIDHINFYAGIDNFLNQEATNTYLGFGINFIDDNLKYLLFSAAGAAN